MKASPSPRVGDCYQNKRKSEEMTEPTALEKKHARLAMERAKAKQLELANAAPFVLGPTYVPPDVHTKLEIATATPFLIGPTYVPPDVHTKSCTSSIASPCQPSPIVLPQNMKRQRLEPEPTHYAPTLQSQEPAYDYALSQQVQEPPAQWPPPQHEPTWPWPWLLRSDLQNPAVINKTFEFHAVSILNASRVPPPCRKWRLLSTISCMRWAAELRYLCLTVSQS
jgi:hypothetical protein